MVKSMIFDANKCIHYNGTVNKRCEAGVYYEKVGRAGSGTLFNHLPCFADNGISGLCTECQYPSEQQLAESDAWISNYIAKITTARNVIVDHLEKSDSLRRDVSGEITCPHCGGKLKFSYAGAYNRHIHAQCETADCVGWME